MLQGAQPRCRAHAQRGAGAGRVHHGGEQIGAGVAAAPAEHRKDVVPEGLRHTSEEAAELGSRLKAAIMERLQPLAEHLHHGHQLCTPGADQPHKGGGHGSVKGAKE
ncbi:hypothetical protein TSOC_000349 [Tetrabaena socialis]|uniref:Uncharacterized protein n=1 Tax=Tetrabaena socialis TaxID=47790 RepID=A0A2J8AJK5_9CHLO|nr:hypothetical protein TSOC_000349 [Tetrabaena socialis]|eukprot:PNH12694.1 hypothetical protein TSOC_000349 [Tetrabaena socialis]